MPPYGSSKNPFESIREQLILYGLAARETLAQTNYRPLAARILGYSAVFPTGELLLAAGDASPTKSLTLGVAALTLSYTGIRTYVGPVESNNFIAINPANHEAIPPETMGDLGAEGQ